ncbi:VWA domain-containing protein [Yinghuangia sp. ASG 101]|uniref:VWA domain-containing protein n=1 Tax=Yinghuangia sp. ASG 101 TaxID=2896848 RepID=UPI001E6190F4|nr:VWA domain-containing protein [Yinghuangia sp. ASG 101]UGQ11316.1 VWA domain-containing protein [Yinghuangia sp. ASG 101]
MSIRSRHSRAAVLVLPALLLGGLLPSAPAASAAPGTPAVPEVGSPPKINLVLDLSGSMKADDAGGQTRLAAAKQAVGRIIDTAPQDAPLGVRVYGASYPGEDTAQGCADTGQLFPVGAMDAAARASASQKVAALDAVGFTPIGVALRAAAQDLGTDGPRRIVLISDGEDTCAPPPPCDVAKELKAAGIDLAIDAVGFKTTGAARDQLKCIAQATGGSYADADNAEALTANLGTLFRRAWTTYQATGTPVSGSVNGCSDAPLITPGQYLDGFTGGRDLYYKVKKRPDQQLQVSATAIAEKGYPRGSGITVQAGTIGDGSPDDWLRQYEQTPGWTNNISAGARSKPGEAGKAPAPDDIGCIMIENKITNAGNPPLPVELLVGIADDSTAKAGETVPQPRTGPDAVGGFSFNSATPIAPGAYRQSIAVGEAPFWRVDLKAGQQLTVTAGVEIPADFPNGTATGWTVNVYNATRELTKCNAVDSRVTKLFTRQTGRFEWVCGPWQVAKPEDAGGLDPKGYAVPGTYYIQLQVAEPSDQAKGVIVPIDLAVDITGAPRPGNDPVFAFDGNAGSGAPGNTSDASGVATGGQATGGNGAGQTENGTDLPGESASSKDDKSTASQLALPLGIVAAVALLGGVGYYGLRRR